MWLVSACFVGGNITGDGSAGVNCSAFGQNLAPAGMAAGLCCAAAPAIAAGSTGTTGSAVNTVYHQ
jgi:hypothetical protein